MPTPRLSGPHVPMAVVVPAFGGLVVLGLLIGFMGDVRSSAAKPDPQGAAVVAGEPAGIVWAVATPAGVAWPSTDESATADEQRGTPKHRDHHHRHASNGSGAGFEASIDVCRSVERNRCVGRVETLNAGRQHFWLLVSFHGSSRGDRIGTQLRGPDGTIDAPDFTVRGGDGYAWAEITRSLRRGEWTAVATRNGDEVATAGFSVD